MGLTDIFSQNAFSMYSMTAAIQKAPYKPGLLGEMGMWQSYPVTGNQVVVEEYDGTLSLLPTAARGAQSSLGTPEKRTVRSFIIPHIPHNDAVEADDVLNLRAFGTESSLEPLQTAINRKLTRMRNNHEVTHEHMRARAIQGAVLDADGSTVIYNYETEFNQSQPTDAIDMTPTGETVAEQIIVQKRVIEDAIGVGIDSLDMVAICSDGWWDAFIGATEVRDSYARWRDGEFLRVDNRPGFPFAGVRFINYRGAVGGSGFLVANEAWMFPLGIPDMFIEVIAPANYIETVGTMGQKLYAKQVVRDDDTGVKLLSQSNYLPICTRIDAVVNLTIAP